MEKKIEVMSKKEAFIALKDHKPNFQSHPRYRFINPAKSEIGVIIKNILDRINDIIKLGTDLIQWSDSMQVVDWFKNTSITVRDRFTQFDIEDFYASITIELLIRALDFGSQFCEIAELDRAVILHVRRTLLFSGDNMWIRRGLTLVWDRTTVRVSVT